MFRPFDLSGKVALLTGGSGGIGLGMADALAAAGADIILWDIDEARLAAAVDDLAAHSRRVATARVDVTDEAAVNEAMDAAVRQLGRVDTVIAAAGIFPPPVPLRDLALADWRRVQAVNVEGLVLTFRAAIRHMAWRAGKGDPGGSLIGLSSIASVTGAPGGEAYGASKAAVGAIIRSLAVQHARDGIRANAILPGWINTRMTEGMEEDERIARKVTTRIPARRWGHPADFGGIAVYLASDASAYHSGDSIAIDGGYLIF